MSDELGIEHIGVSLKKIYSGKSSGQLHFRQGNIQKYLYFLDGDLVHARTNQPQELLGEVLFRQGKISQDVYSRIDEYIEPRKSIGQILIDNQLISREQLQDGLRYQMREITLNIFPNFMGDLSFQDKKTLSEETFDVRLDVPSLIEDGIRRMKYDPRLKELMTGKYPFPRNREFFFHLTEDEKEIYSALPGTASADTVLRERGFSSELFWRSLYLFLCLDLIGIRSHAGEAGSAPEPSDAPTATARETEPGPPASSSEGELVPEVAEVMEIADRLASLDYFNILDVPRDAPVSDVKKAYFRLARSYHPDRFSRDLSQDIRDKIDAVFDFITKAYHTLCDEDERAEYERKTREGASDGGRDVEKRADVKFRQGKTLFNQARYKDALIFLEEAVRMQGHKASYFLLLAMTQSKLRDYHRKAVENYRTAIRLEPWSVDGYLGLGMLYKKEGMPVMAAKQFRKALSFDSDNRVARKELEEIEPKSKGGSLKDILSGDLGGLLNKLKKKR